jgi:AcrR family transcriptional regulator
LTIVRTDASFQATMASEALKLRPRETRGDRTRARLVEAALAEFQRHGFERASVARIAKQAGVSRPTFYFHFPAKEDLLRELQAGLQASLAERITRSRSLRDALDVFVNGILEVQREVGALVFAEILRVQTRGRPLSEPQDEPVPVRDALAPWFVQGSAELREGLDPERATQLYLSSIFGYLIAPASTDPAHHPKDLVALTSLFLRDAHDEVQP